MSNLSEGEANVPYRIKEIRTEDQEMIEFLFSLGCYQDEEVTIISRLAGNIVISVKDARYSINTELAKVIII
ncbi:FeoA family protein [Eubacteriaceae bacterium ES3]|nr:FeoA family protein [Eubacteriaceae bacterium ES3]